MLFFLLLVFTTALTLPLQVADRSLIDHGTLAIQARTNVYPRRSRRRFGSLTYAEHWPTDQDAIQRLAIHRRQFERWNVSECESDL